MLFNLCLTSFFAEHREETIDDVILPSYSTLVVQASVAHFLLVVLAELATSFLYEFFDLAIGILETRHAVLEPLDFVHECICIEPTQRFCCDCRRVPNTARNVARVWQNEWHTNKHAEIYDGHRVDVASSVELKMLSSATGKKAVRLLDRCNLALTSATANPTLVTFCAAILIAGRIHLGAPSLLIPTTHYTSFYCH